MKVRHRKVKREEGYILDLETRSIPLSIEEFKELMNWKAEPLN